MMAARSKPTRRLVAGGLALAVVAVVVALILVPIELLRRQEQEQQRLLAQVNSLQSKLVDREQLIGERLRLERRQSERTELIEADTPVLAGAELQRTLRDLIESSNGVLEATSLAPPEPAEPFTKITAAVEVLSGIKGLRDLLHAVESHKPTLIVEELRVRRRTSENEIHDLDISLTVSAFTPALPPTVDAADATADRS